MRWDKNNTLLMLFIILAAVTIILTAIAFIWNIKLLGGVAIFLYIALSGILLSIKDTSDKGS